MKRFLIACLALTSYVLYSQDIRGVYFHTSYDSSAMYNMSVTVISDASKNVNRPSVKVNLGTGTPPYSILTLTNTTTANDVKISTYYHSRLEIGNYLSPFYTDSFWVTGVKNFSAPNKSRVLVNIDLAHCVTDYPDKGPEVTNLPISLANFTIVGNQVQYNPNCIDADGDSLSYSFFPIWGTSYYIPANATINPITGLFTFSKDSTDNGLYAFGYYIAEWRKVSGYNTLLGYTNISFVLTTNPTLGVRENIRSSFDLKLYPNPANEKLSFISEALNEKNTDLEIYNALGEIVLRKNNFDLTESLDVSGLSNGLYSVRISNGSTTFGSRFIKSNK